MGIIIHTVDKMFHGDFWNMQVNEGAFSVRAGRLASAILILLLTVWVSFKTAYAIKTARQLEAAAQSVKEHISTLHNTEDLEGDLEDLQAELTTVDNLLVDLRRAIWPFNNLLGSLKWVPVYGDDFAAIPNILEIAESMSSIAHILDDSFSHLLADDNVRDKWPSFINALQMSQDQLNVAQNELETIHIARAQIGGVDALQPRLQGAMQDIDDAIDLLDQIFVGLNALPVLLGTDEPHHVLVLVQNADEMRPAGGWTAAAVYVVVENGEITEIVAESSNSQEIDRFDEYFYDEPPMPLSEYMQLPFWAFRDATWSPDFPTSATKAVELYTLGRQVPVETVVAINQFSILELVKLTGSIELDDGTVVTEENFIQFYQDSYGESIEERGWLRRKDFLVNFAPQMIESFRQGLSSNNALLFGQALQNLSRSNNLLAYSETAAVQQLFELIALDGSIEERPGDYVYVVDANVGYTRTDPNIQRSTSYHVSLTDLAAPYGVLDFTYKNLSTSDPESCEIDKGIDNAYRASLQTCYANYLRVYLPDGSEAIELPEFEIPTIYTEEPQTYTRVEDPTAGHMEALLDEKGKEVFGGLMILTRGASVSGSLLYLLPPEEVLSRQAEEQIVYELLIQKQPGVSPYPLKVTIDLPDDRDVIFVEPEPTYYDPTVVYYDRYFDRDLQVRLVFASARP